MPLLVNWQPKASPSITDYHWLSSRTFFIGPAAYSYPPTWLQIQMGSGINQIIAVINKHKWIESYCRDLSLPTWLPYLTTNERLSHSHFTLWCNEIDIIRANNQLDPYPWSDPSFTSADRWRSIYAMELRASLSEQRIAIPNFAPAHGPKGLKAVNAFYPPTAIAGQEFFDGFAASSEYTWVGRAHSVNSGNYYFARGYYFFLIPPDLTPDNIIHGHQLRWFCLSPRYTLDSIDFTFRVFATPSFPLSGGFPEMALDPSDWGLSSSSGEQVNTADIQPNSYVQTYPDGPFGNLAGNASQHMGVIIRFRSDREDIGTPVAPGVTEAIQIGYPTGNFARLMAST